MTTGLLITTAGQAAITADLSGGTDLVLTHVAFGDSSGVPYPPNAAQTALVNERYRSTIASVAVVDGAIVIDAVIPADTPDGSSRPSHGFNIAEAGIYSNAGTLIGVARMGNGYKPPPSSGQAAIATFRFKLAVANPSAITVVIDPQAQINIGRHVRPFFMVVDGVQNAPPGSPAIGATYVIGASPTGAWSGFAHRLAQWVGVWALSTVPTGHVVVDASKAVYAGDRWLERTASGWQAGLTRVLQQRRTNFAVAGGTANALTATLDPPPLSGEVTAGFEVSLAVSTPNTGAATLDIGDGGGAIAIRRPDLSALIPGDTAGLPTLRFNGTYWLLVSRAADDYLITTAITKTVYGTSPDFADLPAAFEWLSRRRITTTGSVDLAIAAGAHALPASLVTLDHPDGQRITITGAALTGGGAPIVSDFQITGVNSGARATDTAAHLTMLQGRFATRFTGSAGSGIALGRVGLISRILTQGVGGSGAVAALTITGQGKLQNVAVQGAPNLGLQVTGSVELVGNVYISGSGASHGVSASAGGQMLGAGALQSYSNALDGINMGQNASMAVGAVTTRGNGLSGVSMLEGGTFGCQSGSSFSNNGQDGIQVDKSAAHIRSSTVSANTRDGIHATMGAVVQTDSTTFSGNGVNPCYASDMSIITNFSNTGIGGGTCSPVVNGGVGNRNSLISAV